MGKHRPVLALLLTLVLGASFNAASAGSNGQTGSVPCNDGAVTYTPTAMWPPNHKLQDVNITYNEGEGDGDTTSLRIDLITHNQFDSDGAEWNGSGNPSLTDWDYTPMETTTGSDPDEDIDASDPKDSVKIRSERSGHKTPITAENSSTGRTYTIRVTCTDEGDQSGDGEESQTVDLKVGVPHDCRGGACKGFSKP